MVYVLFRELEILLTKLNGKMDIRTLVQNDT